MTNQRASRLGLALGFEKGFELLGVKLGEAKQFTDDFGACLSRCAAVFVKLSKTLFFDVNACIDFGF